jgi:P2-related tail formation protein
MVHEHIVNGEILLLIQPIHIGASWSQDNKIFRSSVWNSKGELVSAGFPKFVNWGEKPEIFPVPESLKDAIVPEKLDGSLLIVSKYKGFIIIRTRGTVDASKLDNAAELEIFKTEILPKVAQYIDEMKWSQETWPVSVLFEWVSPTNKIVLNYGDQPDWYLVGMVNHSDYSLIPQGLLDGCAVEMGLKRPKSYQFRDVAELLANVDQWKGQEGVCVYSNNGQTIHKVKSAWYLVRHHMKSELNNVEKVMDFWFENGKPDFLKFKELVLQFDYEIWEQVQGNASRLSDAYKEVQRIIEGMKKFLREQVMVLNYNRRMQATIIKQSYGETNRASYLFTLLDGKELDDKQLKKLMFQVLKKL